jgi:regulator of sigma E protease
VHEYGHFIAARRNGVEVEEFGIFFPPALYKKKTKDGWVFSVNAIPLGGLC